MYYSYKHRILLLSLFLLMIFALVARRGIESRSGKLNEKAGVSSKADQPLALFPGQRRIWHPVTMVSSLAGMWHLRKPPVVELTWSTGNGATKGPITLSSTVSGHQDLDRYQFINSRKNRTLPVKPTITYTVPDFLSPGTLAEVSFHADIEIAHSCGGDTYRTSKDTITAREKFLCKSREQIKRERLSRIAADYKAYQSHASIESDRNFFTELAINSFFGILLALAAGFYIKDPTRAKDDTSQV